MKNKACQLIAAIAIGILIGGAINKKEPVVITKTKIKEIRVDEYKLPVFENMTAPGEK
jgi:hypothetical protein